MARMGAIKPLVELLAATNPIDVQAMAALAVTEIARNNVKNQTSAADLGAVSFLVSQCRSAQEGAEVVKAEAAGAIWVMSQGHPTNKVAFADAGGTKPLVQLLANGNARAQQTEEIVRRSEDGVRVCRPMRLLSGLHEGSAALPQSVLSERRARVRGFVIASPLSPNT